MVPFFTKRLVKSPIGRPVWAKTCLATEEAIRANFGDRSEETTIFFLQKWFSFSIKIGNWFYFHCSTTPPQKKKIQPSYVQLFDVFSSFHICQICKIFPSRRFCPNIGMPTFPQPFSFLCRDRRLHPRQIIIRWWWDCNLIKKRIQNLWILILTNMRGCSYIT